MSKRTIIDVGNGEIETIENRVEALEQQVKMLLESQKNILEHFQEMILAVTEIATGAVEEEVFENIINLSLSPSDE